MRVVIEMFLPLISSFILAYLLGKILIPILHRMKYGQGPKAHMKKQGTPTIGGLIFIISTFIVTILYSVFYVKTLKNDAVIILLIFLAFGFVGFLDDYLKIRRKKNLGLRAYQKMILLMLITFVIYVFSKDTLGTNLYIPILNVNINLYYLYLPFYLFILQV